MTIEDFFKTIQSTDDVSEIEACLREFESTHKGNIDWVPVGGKKSNRGIIEVSADPGRSLIERITNGIDAILESEHDKHNGQPVCKTPREAATAWLNIPENGLSEMTIQERRQLSNKVIVKISPGGGNDSRVLGVRDYGIGVVPEKMSETILSLNENNKLQKHYLAGTYGQGGSSTFAVSKYTLIASRSSDNPSTSFTLVCFLDLPPDEYKTGHYVYLTIDGSLPKVKLPIKKFPIGTEIKHYGYDLSNYPSPLGPNSIYGLLNQTLFDPILPIWLDNRIHDYRRVIKGSRNALNGAIDEGDEKRRRPDLVHNIKMFYVSLGDFGRIGVEYWVLERPDQKNKRPSAAFINPQKPFILTLNGQSHAEFSSLLLRKYAELPYLSQCFICHIDCNYLAPSAKRTLFVSNREEARFGVVYQHIQDEIVKVLRSDDILIRLNDEARLQGMHETDESATKEIRKEVARILRIHGIDISQAVGGELVDRGNKVDRPTHPHTPRSQPEIIDLHEPPTYIHLLWKEEKEITFYPEQRRYIRIETDAHNQHHNPYDRNKSNINVIVTGESISFKGSTSLKDGRMRIIIDGIQGGKVGDGGLIRVELSRPGLSTLSDERKFRIVDVPPARPGDRHVTLPPFDVRSVNGPRDEFWATLGWPEDINTVASSSLIENGVLVVYYSKVFPRYANQLLAFEKKDTAKAISFTKRYEVWLAVHSLLLHQDQQNREGRSSEEEIEDSQEREYEERCRIAVLATLFATRETQQPSIREDGNE